MTAQTADGPHRRLAPDERRTQIVQAALPIFATQGYYATSMEDIAASARISKPVLYRCFISKLELYLAVLDYCIDELQRRVGEADSAPAYTRERSAALINALLDFAEQSPHAFRLIVESDRRTGELVTGRMKRLEKSMAEAIDASFSRSIDPEQRALLAAGCAGLANRVVLWWIKGNCAIPRKEVFDLFQTLVSFGLDRVEAEAET